MWLYAAKRKGAALDIIRQCNLMISTIKIRIPMTWQLCHFPIRCTNYPSLQHGQLVRFPAPRSGMTTPLLHARPPSTTCIATQSKPLHSSCCICRCALQQAAVATLHTACLPAAETFCLHWHAQPVRSL
jgi:hypothetical protein